MNSLDKQFFLEVILKWQHFWMNQTQNSEEDFDNYFGRALGVDANMRHHLARMLAEAVEKIEGAEAVEVKKTM